MIRVVVVDDQELVRSGFVVLLRSSASVEVVGEAADGVQAWEVCRRTQPDVVLMDVRMPRMDGLEATRAITAAQPATRVIVLTTFELDEYVFGALRAGAAGFLLKSTEAAALLDAVRRVAAGEGVVAPEVTRRLLAAFVAPPPAVVPSPESVEGYADLTARERDVLGCLARGLSNAELAAELVITEATAKTHVSRVLAKLGCSSRMQAAIKARAAGLG